MTCINHNEPLEIRIDKSLSKAKKNYRLRNNTCPIEWKETVFFSFSMGEVKVSANVSEVDETEYRFAICYMEYGKGNTYFALFHIGKNEIAEERWCLGDGEWDFGTVKTPQKSNLFRTQLMQFKTNADIFINFYLPLFYPGFRIENYLPSLIKCFYNVAYNCKEANSRFAIKQLIDSEMERIYLKEKITENNIKVIKWKI